MTVAGKIPFLVWVTALLFISGCATDIPAPVVDGANRGQHNPESANRRPDGSPTREAKKNRDRRPDIHVVQKGDTFYKIALQYGMEYRELANLNALADTNLIQVGQVLKLRQTSQADNIPAVSDGARVETIPFKTKPVNPIEVTPRTPLITRPKAIKLPYSAAALARLEQSAIPDKPESPTTSATLPAPAPSASAITERETDDMTRGWIWPTQGTVIARFNQMKNRKGLDISGKSGQAIHAARSGKVVYSGTGLRGYGKLVIIKHNPVYLSAYAHNRRVLVNEGQTVMRGQKIAEMGDTDADRVKLHFEIRQMGKPVDPIKYLY